MPLAATAGCVVNSALLLFVTVNVSVWPVSPGPALRFVAQFAMRLEPGQAVDRLIRALGEARRVVHRVDRDGDRRGVRIQRPVVRLEGERIGPVGVRRSACR